MCVFVNLTIEISLGYEGAHAIDYSFVGLILEVTRERRLTILIGTLKQGANLLVTFLIKFARGLVFAHAFDYLEEVFTVDFSVKVEFGETA